MNRTVLACLVLMASASAAIAATSTKPAPAARKSMLGQGYLAMQDLPDAAVFVGPPPATGSAAEARDKELSEAALRVQDGPRWQQAAVDADLMADDVTAVMSCAAGREIGPAATPETYKLLRTSASNLGFSTSIVKKKYQRARPFMVNGAPMCTPQLADVLRQDGSYPSGHSAIGYGWGLLLAELLPDRAAQLVARGIAYGDSRRFCNVHWASDVEVGRPVAAAVVAKLHADSKFSADLKKAKAELRTRKPVAPSRDCAAESAALAIGQ